MRSSRTEEMHSVPKLQAWTLLGRGFFLLLCEPAEVCPAEQSRFDVCRLQSAAPQAVVSGNCRPEAPSHLGSNCTRIVLPDVLPACVSDSKRGKYILNLTIL